MYCCCCCCSVAKSSLTLCDPVDCSRPGSPVLHHLLLKFMSIGLVKLSHHLILCCPLLLLSSIFPSIRVFSNESVLCIMWPKYWTSGFRFGIMCVCVCVCACTCVCIYITHISKGTLVVLENFTGEGEW